VRALSALRDAGLGAKPGARPFELAAGERQRLALARALALSPRLVLADEPAAAGDEPVTAEVVHLLRGLQARGATVLVATRSGDLAARLEARVLGLAAGRLTGPEGSSAARTQMAEPGTARGGGGLGGGAARGAPPPTQ